MKMLVEELSNEVSKPPNLRQVDGKIIKEKTAEVNEILRYISVNTLEEINNLMEAARNVITKLSKQ